jgi:isoquinoline 1-oxidoreductase alpha subunit
VITATSLLKQTAKPTDEEIEASMINLCRCGTYNAIRAAVHDLAGRSEKTAHAEAAPAAIFPAGTIAGVTAGAVLLSGIGAHAANPRGSGDAAGEEKA